MLSAKIWQNVERFYSKETHGTLCWHIFHMGFILYVNWNSLILATGSKGGFTMNYTIASSKIFQNQQQKALVYGVIGSVLNDRQLDFWELLLLGDLGHAIYHLWWLFQAVRTTDNLFCKTQKAVSPLLDILKRFYPQLLILEAINI